VVIDVPQEWAATYCASLGHKANHRTPVNAEYAPLYHPRFGDVKCVRCVRDVAAGEELTVDYGYLGDHGYPDWWSAWPAPVCPTVTSVGGPHSHGTQRRVPGSTAARRK
jgi:hypothetical protein